jgi:chromosome segregation ATPase
VGELEELEFDSIDELKEKAKNLENEIEEMKSLLPKKQKTFDELTKKFNRLNNVIELSNLLQELQKTTQAKNP